MAAGNVSYLSLAYLIEISFVINLAYHELQTFKLREAIKDEGNIISQRLKGMTSDDVPGMEEIFDEYTQLTTFHEGKNLGAWEGSGTCRYFYRKLIFKGRDRRIIRFLLCTIVMVLLFNTAMASVNIPLPFSLSSDIHSFIWTIQFGVLALSIIIPVFFMWMIRRCYEYIFGGAPESPDEMCLSGRLHALEQAYLKKILQYQGLVKTNGT